MNLHHIDGKILQIREFAGDSLVFSLPISAFSLSGQALSTPHVEEVVFMPVRARRCFTLAEVLVAVAILGISLVMLLSLLGSARERILRAEKRWAEQHLLARATEFFLLAGAETEMPADMLPEGFSAECQVQPVELEDATGKAPHNAELVAFEISVFDKSGTRIARRILDKIVTRNE